MTDTGQRTAVSLAVVFENAELRQQLGEVQNQGVELAVDAGELHAENASLRARIDEVERERDGWRTDAEQRMVG